MPRRLYTFVVLIVGFSFGHSALAARIPACERSLMLYTEESILHDAGDVLARVEMPLIHNDSVNPLMGVFEPVRIPHDQGHKNELLTARDFASFLHHQHGQRFVFAGQFKGAFVPVFDGLVLDADGDPAYNVSLKFASFRMPFMRKETLIESLKGRLNHKDEKQRTRTLYDWLKAVNLWRPNGNGQLLIPFYERDLERGVQLAQVFGLTNPCHSHCGRELRTVLDMRESGYSFDFVSDPEVQRDIQKVVERYGYGAFTLTLLWDSARVLEFN